MKKINAGIKVVFTPEEFKEKGFDGEVAKYMRENKNTAIVGDTFGVDRHIIQFDSRESWNNYSNPYYDKK